MNSSGASLGKFAEVSDPTVGVDFFARFPITSYYLNILLLFRTKIMTFISASRLVNVKSGARVKVNFMILKTSPFTVRVKLKKNAPYCKMNFFFFIKGAM